MLKLLPAAILTIVCLSCEKGAAETQFGLSYIYIPQATVSGGTNNQYPVPSGDGEYTHNYRLDMDMSRFNIILGVLKSGMQTNKGFSVDIVPMLEETEKIIASGAIPGAVLMPAYELPSSVEVPQGVNTASFSLSLDFETLNKSEYAGKKFVLQVGIANPTEYELAENNTEVLVILDYNAARKIVLDATGAPGIIYTYKVTGGNKNVVKFDASQSVNVETLTWNFGDGSPSATGLEQRHVYEESGEYTVEVVAEGKSGSEVRESFVVEIDYVEWTGLQGGSMEEGDEIYWETVAFNAYNEFPYVFGYTGDSPDGGKGGCLQVGAVSNDGRGLQLVQKVDVVADTDYRVSARLKAPENCRGMKISLSVNDKKESVLDADDKHFFSLNSWGNWGTGTAPDGSHYSYAVDGDFLEIAKQYGSGSGLAVDGIYHASESGFVYVSVGVLSHWGEMPADILFDEIMFEPVE